ncbi:MAG: phenylacetate-CoA ligase [Pseudonocardiales bacterium]|jgi:phenylacetate-CoA ligase|nr:phenylacetate-CoA ligase [Pseudonocardiales bacterium]MDT7676741.1 phenylacetate-CoA ligase [Pseudonocardiales bacterium]MDT7691028.1 phenylacetate-CoA ligase [Pseudonocardiales bacterium]MDT7747919.1 phenylacetate-CoA ligase [Pseudonocardiales bacterium]
MTEQPYWNVEAQTLPPDTLAKLQTERLREAVEQAARAPFFADRLAAAGVRPDDIREPADVALLPRFSKADIRESEQRTPPIGDYRPHGLDRAVRIAMSTGTTGRPTAMIWTRRDLGVECELSARNHYRHGIRPGMVVVSAHPGYLNGGQGLQQAAYEHLGCLLVSIGPPDSVDAAERALRSIAELPIDRWQLFPSALLRLREAAARIGFDGLPEPEEIGPLTQYTKISAGMECVAYLGSSCGRSDGSHLAEDYALVEAVDPVTGEPVPDGQRGQLVVTSLGRDNPMLRYDLEDVVRIDAGPCPCGETTRRGFWEGRAKDIVEVAGRQVLPIDVWRHLDPAAEYVIIRPERPADRLTVRVEGARDTAVEDALTEALGVPVDVTWVGTGELPRAAYKAQRVVPAGS